MPDTMKLVNATALDAALTATASAIKTIKGDPSSTIAFDSSTGFASAISSIEVEGVDVSSTTVTADDVPSGKYFFNASGIRTEGTITEKTSSDLTISDNLTVNVPAGVYTSAASKTVTDANLIASNIKTGATIFGVTGTSGMVYTDVEYTITSSDYTLTFNDDGPALSITVDQTPYPSDEFDYAHVILTSFNNSTNPTSGSAIVYYKTIILPPFSGGSAYSIMVNFLTTETLPLTINGPIKVTVRFYHQT